MLEDVQLFISHENLAGLDQICQKYDPPGRFALGW